MWSLVDIAIAGVDIYWKSLIWDSVIDLSHLFDPVSLRGGSEFARMRICIRLLYLRVVQTLTIPRKRLHEFC